MRNNSFVTELLRGEWLLHNPEAYYEYVESLKQKLDLNFTSKYKQEEKSLDILDAFGNPIRSNDGNIEIPKNSIAQVSMRGEIVAYSDWCAMGADEIVAQLYAAQKFENVDATVFRIDSPGGSTKAIDTFREFAKYKTKPIVGLVRDGLSLGYWAAIEVCDYIMLDGNISSRVGSIGVTASFRDNTKALEALGVKIHEIYPPESNYKNKDFMDARDNSDYEGIIKNSLSPLAISFQNAVKEKRPNLKQEDGVLHGAVYFADEALRLGLIDSIGDSRMAIKKANELALSSKVKSTLY